MVRLREWLIVLSCAACIPWITGCYDAEESACEKVAQLYCSTEHPNIGRLTDLLDEEK